MISIISPVSTEQQRLTVIGSMWTLDAVYWTYQEQWPIGMVESDRKKGRERGSRESMLSACLDVNDDV